MTKTVVSAQLQQGGNTDHAFPLPQKETGAVGLGLKREREPSLSLKRGSFSCCHVGLKSKICQGCEG